MTDEAQGWKRCSSCKKPILFLQQFWVCNVSTCNRKRTGLAFCSVACWDAHLPIVNHRESWAEERTAPSAMDWKAQQEEPAQRTRRKQTPAAEPAPAEPAKPVSPPRIIVRRPGNRD